MNVSLIAARMKKQFKKGDKVYFVQNVKATAKKYTYYTNNDTKAGIGTIEQITPYMFVIHPDNIQDELRQNISFSDLYCNEAIICSPTEQERYCFIKKKDEESENNGPKKKYIVIPLNKNKK